MFFSKEKLKAKMNMNYQLQIGFYNILGKTSTKTATIVFKRVPIRVYLEFHNNI